MRRTIRLALAAATVAAPLTVLAGTSAHAAIPDGVVATVDVTCDRPYPRLTFVFHNDSPDWVDYTTTYTINGGAPQNGGGGGASGSGGGSSIGISPGDVVTASISIGADVADSIPEVVAGDCLLLNTDVNLEVVCEGTQALFVIDISNPFESKYAPTYSINYSIWNGISVQMGATSAEVDVDTPYHYSRPVNAGESVSALIKVDDTDIDEIENVIVPDCSDDGDEGSGAGLPEAGSDTAPITLAAGGLLAVGALLTFGVRRRRTA